MTRCCKNCGGDGSSVDGGDCPACGGTGREQRKPLRRTVTSLNRQLAAPRKDKL